MSTADDIKGTTFTYRVGDREIRAFVSEEDAEALDALGKSLAITDEPLGSEVVAMGGSIFRRCEG